MRPANLDDWSVEDCLAYLSEHEIKHDQDMGLSDLLELCTIHRFGGKAY